MQNSGTRAKATNTIGYSGLYESRQTKAVGDRRSWNIDGRLQTQNIDHSIPHQSQSLRPQSPEWIFSQWEHVPAFRSSRLCDSCGRGTHASIRLTPEPPSHLVASTRLLMRQRPEPLRSVLSRCLYVYALLATIYTLGNLSVSILPYLSPSPNRLLRPPPPRVTFPSTMTVQQAEELLWSNFSLSEHHSLASWDPVLSRAFPRLMHPSRIVPYYYRATGNFESDDITVTTLISSDRFPVFHNLVQRYKGVLILVICSVNPSSTSAQAQYLLQFTSLCSLWIS